MNIRGTSSFLDGLVISIVPFLTFISIILERDRKKKKTFQEIVHAYFMYLIHVNNRLFLKGRPGNKYNEIAKFLHRHLILYITLKKLHNIQ